MRWVLFFSLSAALFFRWFSGVSSICRFPDLGKIHWMAPQASRDLSFLSLGMRRLAADVAFIELLQYYGTPEHPEGADERTHALHGRDYGGGYYPQVYSRTLRILDLDPHFRYAALYSAGALAFNLNRPAEAVRLLEYALKLDPKQWKYQIYLAALAYQKTENFPSLVQELEAAAQDPECPALFKNILAGLYVKMGRLSDAVRIYQDLIGSRDPDYRVHAERQIGKLLKRSKSL